MKNNKTLKTALFSGILFKLIDIYTTLLVVSEDIKHEFNPTVRHLMDVYGVLSALTVNALAVILLLLILYKERRPFLLIVSSSLLACVAVINILDKFLIGYVLG